MHQYASLQPTFSPPAASPLSAQGGACKQGGRQPHGVQGGAAPLPPNRSHYTQPARAEQQGAGAGRGERRHRLLSAFNLLYRRRSDRPKAAQLLRSCGGWDCCGYPSGGASWSEWRSCQRSDRQCAPTTAGMLHQITIWCRSCAAAQGTVQGHCTTMLIW